MLIDHIFVFCRSEADADELVDFGLTEGSGRSHEGVGTANRRFFFENFYLEILRVESEEEAKRLSQIGIWDRYDHKASGYSEYGLCLENCEGSDSIFDNAIKWKPDFLPEGQFVDILTNEKMPWIFRFPANRARGFSSEPMEHPLGVKRLSRAIFGLPELSFRDSLKYISENFAVEFYEAPESYLILEFDNAEQGREKSFSNLNLTIRY